MKQVLFVITVVAMSSGAFAQLHQPTWMLIDDRNMSSFDMLTTRLGLIGVNDNGSILLAKYDSGAINGIFFTNGPVSSVIIRDEFTANFTATSEFHSQTGSPGTASSARHFSILYQ